MGYVYEVWCGRPGLKPGLLTSYQVGETAYRVRDHQQELLNHDITDPSLMWRVWVEKKREGYDELHQRRHERGLIRPAQTR